MKIVVYKAVDQVEDHQRFCAQFEQVKDNFYVTCHGPTPEIARAKAQLIIDYQATPPLDRKAFDLKGKLAALGSDSDDDGLLV